VSGIPDRAEAPAVADSDEARELARALYRAYNDHEPKRAGALYHPEAFHVEVARGARADGRDAVTRGLARFLRLFPDARWEALSEIHEDGAVAVPYRLTGTLHAPMGPVVPRGQRLDLRGVHVLSTRDGWIMSSEDYWDAMTFQSQMADEMRAGDAAEGAA
jgi:steroid delta-isomerase-like uncharacterized protein